ncbi:pyridoxal phosphate-dependent aminotransferase [Clostridium sp. FAM 1755]|uniref:Aminotransferase n=1 Tax=Clostridium botulinum TaxID=1491 RepID=A0A6M0SYX5_CLOBO|nr:MULTISPECIES: pyridoxal phosphate-dependent aminotransferase [Clostridium]NFA59772.1 pyridoxal phosphate-dependent aminotransferase [Clostridium botulinum]KOR25996.1 aspartate aminotransferase [Clostridium sp. L74]NFI72124.1 pyridoxal phosphate-dependent aminotransferase [Clostridium sporogenes]NFL73572.1 pyridoxal phosphate-dependent aminotransferase [Clostridium sporogenes]NFM23663.1 pyridoxal phosphate-dependent aminotransferase [Clostridium sporogenes]
MISNEMLNLGKKRSIIRDIFEYGATRKKEIGAENVYDFSLGNPSIPAPDCVNETIKELLEKEDSIRLHSYTSAQGDLSVRKTISDSINNKYSTNLSPDNIYMTVGAAASLSISLKALAVQGDEFIVFTPFFPEYRVFIQNAGGTPVVVKSNEDDFQIDINNLIEAITPKTKAVLINSPNNPSGVIISEEGIKSLCKVLEEKSNEYGHPIYLISDEPYRELVYDDIEVPYLTKYYANTFVCYSFSKSLSLPGERIGYIVVSNEMENWQDVYAAVCGAGRSLGYVCAPSLFQRVIAKCIDQTADISVYKKNRDILYNGLTELGYTCVKPDGAFYLFVKSMEPDAYAFYEKAKKHELLIVPADDFGAPGYVRISYCVTTEQIKNSMPAFEKLAKEYK